MFIAREAGAELVGGFGNRTAVMNNDQIVESVSNGVFKAVCSALSGFKGQTQIPEIKLYLDGKELFINYQQQLRSRGYQTGSNPAFAR